MDHHASYALRLNLFNFYSFPFVHNCPALQSLGFVGVFCLFCFENRNLPSICQYILGNAYNHVQLPARLQKS